MSLYNALNSSVYALAILPSIRIVAKNVFKSRLMAQQRFKLKKTKIGNCLSHFFREKTHLLEMSLEDSEQVALALLENNPSARRVTAPTVRSSKLAAMAASMNKTIGTEQELDLQSPVNTEEDVEENDPTLVKLDDIYIVPETIDEEARDKENVEYSEDNGNCGAGVTDSAFGQLDKTDDNTEQDKGTVSYANGAENCSQEKKDNCNGASTSDSKDLSLSCITSHGMLGAAYRFGSM